MSDEDREIRRIERERRRREDELLLLLLLLLIRARRESQVMAAHGYDPAPIVRRIIAGDDFTGHPGAAPLIRRAMAQAHRDGFRRAGLMAGTRTVERADAGTLAELMLLYAAHAIDMADAMAETLASAVAGAIAEARAEGKSGRELREPIADAFDRSGYSRDNPYAVDIGVERAIVAAHNTGILDAALGRAEALRGVVLGLKHVSIMDARTTPICQSRSGLQLPIDDAYWLTNIPPLHAHCRSTLKVLTEPFTPDESRPSWPPDDGYGEAPAGLLRSLMRV